MFGDAKIATDIPNAAAIQRLFGNVLFGSRRPGCIAGIPLNASSALLTPVPLCPVFAMAIFDEIHRIDNADIR